MNLPAYSLVIATLDRPRRLRGALESVAAQSWRPGEIFVVDASSDLASREIVEEFSREFPLRYRRAQTRSAAMQRNQVAGQLQYPLVGFIDDDVVLDADVFHKLALVFAEDSRGEIGGVAGRMRGSSHSPPGIGLRLYYRVQAGYSHPDYGGHLFGPAINCLPCFGPTHSGPLHPAQWLNSGCVLFRSELFKHQLFPGFEGYSHMEDVYLSASIGKTHRLFFHADACYDHYPSPSPAKQNRRFLARQRLRNQAWVAREVLGIHPWTLLWKLSLHRIFVCAFLLRFRPVGWRGELLGFLSYVPRRARPGSRR